jgi:hypothetical protein
MTLNPEDLISLAQLPRELREAARLLETEKAALDRVKYKTLYGQVLDGTLPAERVGGRWFIRRKDLQEIAAALGLPQRRPGRLRKASAPSSSAAVAA